MGVPDKFAFFELPDVLPILVSRVLATKDAVYQVVGRKQFPVLPQFRVGGRVEIEGCWFVFGGLLSLAYMYT